MISHRASRIAPSETLKISGRAKALKRQGYNIISLSAGEPDFKTPNYICEAAIKAIQDGHHGYTMNTGTPELRQAITDKLKRDNSLDYDPANIVCCNGAKQALGFTVLALIDPEDEVLIPAPYWVSYPQMVNLAEGTPVTVRTSFENEYKLTPDQLEQSITSKTKAFILCSPSNPTGARYTKQELEEMAKVLRKYPDLYIISDEIYEYIVFEGEHTSLLEVAPDLKERSILINGFSKGFAMTGWRLGYLAGPEEVVGAVSKIQSQETSAPSAISQKAGEAAYNHGLEAVYRMRDQFSNRRDFIIEELAEIEGVSCFKPQGAFYVFPDISYHLGRKKPDGETVETSTDLCLYLLEEHGLAVVPGDAFGEPNGIRISYASSMEELDDGMKRLQKALNALS